MDVRSIQSRTGRSHERTESAGSLPVDGVPRDHHKSAPNIGDEQ